jgi:hypothetical protein
MLLHLAALWCECEGQDLNPWTSTGADLESAAVSRLGYPRTQYGLRIHSGLNLRFSFGTRNLLKLTLYNQSPSFSWFDGS